MMNERPLLLVDLDRTLFDTDAFVAGLWHCMQELYALDASTELARISEFFRYSGELYEYDFFSHLADATNEELEDRAVIEAAVPYLAGRFLYGDVTPELIQRIDAIVTFGNERFQQLKIAMCPELSVVPVHFVQEPKGGYLKRTFDRRFIMVDDKDLSGEIDAPSQFVLIDRADTYAQKATTESCEIIRSLDRLLPIIDEAYRLY